LVTAVSRFFSLFILFKQTFLILSFQKKVCFKAPMFSVAHLNDAVEEIEACKDAGAWIVFVLVKRGQRNRCYFYSFILHLPLQQRWKNLNCSLYN